MCYLGSSPGILGHEVEQIPNRLKIGGEVDFNPLNNILKIQKKTEVPIAEQPQNG